MELLVPYEQGARLSELHEVAGDIEREDSADGVRVRAQVPRALAHRFERFSSTVERRGRADAARPSAVRFRLLPRRAAADPRAPTATPARPLRGRGRRRSSPGAGRASAPAIAVEIPDGHAGLVLPRSGSRPATGSRSSTRPGLIDAGYRGEIRVLLLNTDRDEPFAIEPGDRIAQLLVVAVRGSSRSRSRRSARPSAARAASAPPAADDRAPAALTPQLLT